LTWDDVSYVPDNFFDVYKKFALQEDDLLIALTRPVIKSLNVVKTATVRNEDLPCLLNQRVARFLIDQNQINKRFFLQYCYTEFFRNTVEGLCPPGLQPNVSTNQIEDIPFFYPPIYLQNEFAAIAAKVEGIKSRYRQSLTDLETLYGTLSQKAFKGKLDLSRVPLPIMKPEEEKPVATEPLQALAEQGLAINLPDTDYLPDALESAEPRAVLISQWLEAYRGQLGSTPFSAQRFMAAAQTRLAELHPDNDFALGANDYEHIKTCLFEALADGRLQQSRDITGHDKSGAPIIGNQIEIKSGARP
jgi:type I restriction enzyme S subunit